MLCVICKKPGARIVVWNQQTREAVGHTCGGGGPESCIATLMKQTKDLGALRYVASVDEDIPREPPRDTAQ